MNDDHRAASRDARNIAAPALVRGIGPFDATMIVMGGIVGAGIFINPYVVAREARGPAWILGAWIAGGAIALLGAFVYAELAARLPETGGQYAYLRSAFHPLVAFLYGWALLLVIQTGGMAAVAITFARYFRELSGIGLGEGGVAAGTLIGLAAINCAGVRAGTTTQSALMVLKIVAIAALVACGLFVDPGARATALPLPPESAPVRAPLFGFALALVPVLFAYGGWQTAGFVAGEMRDPVRTLSRALLVGVGGVIVLYTAVNAACLRVLGAGGLAATTTPATAVMRAVLGERGATLIAVGICLSALGFLGQSMLTAPRVYFAMARDGMFFDAIAHVDPRTRVPVLAILLQAALATAIALTGGYERILNYVVSVDFVFFGLAACALFVLRRRQGAASFEVPGHPVTTLAFIAASWLVAASAVAAGPRDTAIGVALLLGGLPVYFFWQWRSTRFGQR